MDFDWDAGKSAANRRKHGVSFEEAKSVFEDPHVRIDFDILHSEGEPRWLAFGISNRGRVLVVSHTYRSGVVRIISARKATKAEIEHYEQK